MRNTERVTPTEIESRVDSLEGDDELAEYRTLDLGLKAIASTLRAVIVVGVLMFALYAATAALYVNHDRALARKNVEDRNALIEGVCGSISDIEHTQIAALIAAASVDGSPPADDVIAAYVAPIEEAIERCTSQIPRLG